MVLLNIILYVPTIGLFSSILQCSPIEPLMSRRDPVPNPDLLQSSWQGGARLILNLQLVQSRTNRVARLLAMACIMGSAFVQMQMQKETLPWEMATIDQNPLDGERGGRERNEIHSPPPSCI